MLKLVVVFFLLLESVVLVLAIDKYCIGKDDFAQVPDPTDCSKFYQCMDGTAIPGVCPDGTLFDREIELCLPEEDVECVEEPGSSTSTTESTISTEGTSSDGPTQSSTSISSGSSASTKSDPGSGSSTEPSKDPTKSTKPTPTVPSSTGTPPNTTYPPGKPIFPGPEIPEPGVECPKDAHLSEKPIFLASKMDCGRYYICYLDRPVPLQCAVGTHWNQREHFCDDPFYAQCDKSTEPNPYPDCPRKGKVFLPYKQNCEYFIYCNEGVGSLQRCSFGYGWDIVSKTCTLRTFSRCAA